MLTVSSLPLEQQQLLQSWGVRDFPVQTEDDELRYQPALKLRQLFHHESTGRVDLHQLLANLIWQAYTQIKAGKRPLVQGNIRTFWYVDIKTPLSLLGLLQQNLELTPSDTIESVECDDVPCELIRSEASTSYQMRRGRPKMPKPSTSQYLYDSMTNVFYDFVSNNIFHFAEFGFSDDYAHDRFIGDKYPTVIFVAEKIGFNEFTKTIHDEFGCTALCLGGEPKLLSSEYFTTDLKKVIPVDSAEFLLLACVDYDPFGWIIAQQFQQQLSFFGMSQSKIQFLITQDLFTDKEMDRYKYKLPINSPSIQTIVDNWVREVGGVHGEPYGIESDVVDKTRIRERVASALGARK